MTEHGIIFEDATEAAVATLHETPRQRCWREFLAAWNREIPESAVSAETAAIVAELGGWEQWGDGAHPPAVEQFLTTYTQLFDPIPARTPMQATYRDARAAEIMSRAGSQRKGYNA